LVKAKFELMIAASINLTNDSIQAMIAYLHEVNESWHMNGRIRTKEKCAVCHKPFIHVERLGFLCPEHKTTPAKLYVDLSFKGKRCRIFCDKQGQPLDTYRRASIVQSKIQWELENNTFEPSRYIKAELQGFWITNLLDRFLSHKIASIAPSYQKDYRRMVTVAKDYFNTTDVRDIKKLDLINYRDHLQSKCSLGNKSTKNYLDHFKTFLNYCKGDIEIFDRLPSFPEIEIQAHTFRWLSQVDQVQLFEHVPDADKPIIGFLMLHGCRPSEGRALKCKDVDISNQTITIRATFSGYVYREKRKGRGARPVTIPIHPEMLDYIQDRVKNNLPEAFLFITTSGRYYSDFKLQMIWDDVQAKAGIDKSLRLYDATRHSYASQLANSGTSIFKISRLLGHSSTKMTEKYTHEDINSLKTDIKKLSLKKVESVTKPSPEAFQAKK